MALGVAKEIDDTFKIATAGLLEWLRHDYHLSLIESMQVMSTSIEFDIAEIADSEIVVVAKIRKEILSRLKKWISNSISSFIKQNLHFLNLRDFASSWFNSIRLHRLAKAVMPQ